MPITIIDGFNLNANSPIDYRIVASSSVNRLAITFSYDGLKVFQQDNRKTYVYNGSTSNWDIEGATNITGAGATGYMPYFTSSSNLVNGVMYQGSGYIGINTNSPQSNLQINGNFVGAAQPLTFFIGSKAQIGYNWYNNGTDQVFTSTIGSSRLSFNNGNFSIDTRISSAANSAFSSPLFINANGNPYLTSNDTVYTISNNLNITATSSVSLSTGTFSIYRSGYAPAYGIQLLSTVPVNSNGTFSIASFGGSYVTNIGVIGNNSVGGDAANITIKGGDGNGIWRHHAPAAVINLSGSGGTVSIIAGYGQSSNGFVLSGGTSPNIPGTGGNILIQAGSASDISTPGDVILTAGYNADTTSYGSIFLGNSRMKITDNDVYAYIHDMGTNGIGDSGNTGSPWGLPTIASGQFALTSASFANSINCSFGSVQPALWMRVGNIVSVCGEITINVTTINTTTEFKLTIPIKSHFGGNNTWQLNGLGKIVNLFGDSSAPSGDIVTIEASNITSSAVFVARFRCKPTTNGGQVIKYHYQYELGNWPDSPMAPITA